MKNLEIENDLQLFQTPGTAVAALLPELDWQSAQTVGWWEKSEAGAQGALVSLRMPPADINQNPKSITSQVLISTGTSSDMWAPSSFQLLGDL